MLEYENLDWEYYRKEKYLDLKNKPAEWWLRRGIALAALGSSLGLPAWFYARFIEPTWLEVSRPTVKVDDLPGVSSLWKGYKLAFLSDLHIKRKKPPLPVVEAAFRRVLEERPNLVTLGGDLFDSGKWNPALLDLVCPLLQAGLPVVTVFGNHDYYGRRNEYLRIRENLERAGVRVLINEAYPLEYNGQRAWLAGIDDMFKGEPDVEELAAHLPPGERPLILLTHGPDLLDDFPPGFAHIMLSGHTHGGQVNFALPPFQRSLNWVRFSRNKHHSDYPLGWFHQNQIRLYVSRGLGMSGYQLRFNSRPELVMLEFV